MRSATLIANKVNHIYARNRLRKWLNKCMKFIKLQNSIEIYYKLKLKISCYNRWLRYLYYVYSSRTKGLNLICKSLQQRMMAYDQYLQVEKHVFYFRAYIPYNLMNPITNTSKAIFLRWSYYTGRKIGMIKLVDKIISIRNIKVICKCFYAWNKRCISTKTSYEKNKIEFVIKGLMLDQETIRKYIISTIKQSLSNKLQTWNFNYQNKLHTIAKDGPSFKKFLSCYCNNIHRRLKEEKKMLTFMFENRKMIFNDTCYVAGFAEIGYDCNWSSFWNESNFVEIEHVHKYFKQLKVKKNHHYWFDRSFDEGYKLSEIWVNSKMGLGIVGLRYFVSKGGKQVIMAGARGQCNVGLRQCFEVEEDEHIVKVEVVCGETTLECIRFSTSSGRASVWYGEKNLSVASQIIALRCKAEEDPMNKNSSHMTVFFGAEETLSSKILSFGVIARKVTKFNIFSITIHWLNSVSDCIKAKQEFELLFHLRHTEVMSVSELYPRKIFGNYR